MWSEPALEHRQGIRLRSLELCLSLNLPQLKRMWGQPPRLSAERSSAAFANSVSAFSLVSAPSPIQAHLYAPAWQAFPPKTLPIAVRLPDFLRSAPSSPPSPRPHSQSSQNFLARQKLSPHPALDLENQSRTARRPPPQTQRYSGRSPTPGRAPARLSPCDPAARPTTARDCPSHSAH